MTSHLRASYESVLYEGTSFAFTHPEALAIAGTLRGLRPPDIETCRVLEIGCAVGGNLIPMAFTLPGARFVGIDLFDSQIEAAKARAREIGLANVEFVAMDVTKLDEGFGTFDYIICHGLFSWVPEPVRQAILRVFSQNLSPAGLAYVSFNTYPGWFLKSLVRKMLLYRFRAVADFGSHLGEVRVFLEEIRRLFEQVKNSQSASIVAIISQLLASPDHYLLHEYLEDENQPFYFHEVVERARASGLEYLGEQKAIPVKNLLPPDVLERLEQFASDPVEIEQYGDFLLSGTFRCSVFCHASAATGSTPTAADIGRFLVHARCRPVSDTSVLREGQAHRFARKDGGTVTTNDPWVIAALTAAHRFWPRAATFAEIEGVTRAILAEKPPEADLEEHLSAALRQCQEALLLSFHLRQPGFTISPGERPVGSLLARSQARYTSRVTNLLHAATALEDFDRFILLRLDGTHSRADLASALRTALAAGEISVSGISAEAVGEDLASALPELVEQGLRRLSVNALLLE